MQAIVLCGGKGTRLSALCADRPKVLVPVMGRPFLEWQLGWLARSGISDVHLAAGYRADALEQWMSHRVEAPAVRVALSAEPSALGTGGGLRFVEPFLRSDPFLVLNGDSLMPNLNLDALRRAGESMRGQLVTIAVTRIEEAGRYGTVEFGEDDRVTAFREKAHRASGWINGGVYLVRKALLDRMVAGRALSLETDLFPSLAAEGLVRAFRSAQPLLDMGTPGGLAAMESFLLRHREERL